MVAEARKPIRISGLMRGMLYALAVHKRAQEARPVPPRPRIPLPGLPNPESQLGVPLLVRGELVGVLCIESEMPYRFHEEDKTSIELLGSYLAIAIQNMQLQERAEAAETAEPRRRRRHATRAAGAAARAAPRRSSTTAPTSASWSTASTSIRSLPARIFWQLLTRARARDAPSSPTASCGSTSR